MSDNIYLKKLTKKLADLEDSRLGSQTKNKQNSDYEYPSDQMLDHI